MERWVVTWLKNGKRYAQFVGFKHTAEYVMQERAKNPARTKLEMFTTKKFREAYGTEDVVVV